MNLLNSKQLADIKVCGKILKNALDAVVKNARPGISAYELDQIAEKSLLSAHARPSFKNYFVRGCGSYPSSLCVSINDEVVHGIPTKNKILKNGDIVSFDIGAEYNGICTDMATTIPIGKVSKEAVNLMKVTKKSLEKGIQAVHKGNRIGDIGHAVQSYTEAMGFNVIRDLVGHGIGTKPHMDPQIPNYGRAGSGIEILNGMALAIEPMSVIGKYDIVVGTDNWTISTRDHSLAAHFEHTIIIENGKTLVVTR